MGSRVTDGPCVQCNQGSDLIRVEADMRALENWIYVDSWRFFGQFFEEFFLGLLVIC